MTRVSLVIPCFNQAAFVAAAIESALAQRMAPAEVILVDDGSTDGSAAAAGRFGKRVRLIRQPNRGAASARNAGVAAARHGLIAFLDGDDLWPPQSLAVRLDRLHGSGADFVFGAVSQFRQGGAGESDPLAGRVIGAMLVRREAMAKVGPFDDRLRSAEVIDWIARAAALGLTGVACAETVLLRRIHGANMMLTEAGTAASRMAVLRTIVGRKRAAAAP